MIRPLLGPIAIQEQLESSASLLKFQSAKKLPAIAIQMEVMTPLKRLLKLRHRLSMKSLISKSRLTKTTLCMIQWNSLLRQAIPSQQASQTGRFGTHRLGMVTGRYISQCEIKSVKLSMRPLPCLLL